MRINSRRKETDAQGLEIKIKGAIISRKPGGRYNRHYLQPEISSTLGVYAFLLPISFII